MTDHQMPPRDAKHHEWEKLCAEVTRARELFKKIDGQITWLIAYVSGLPSTQLCDRKDCPYAG